MNPGLKSALFFLFSYLNPHSFSYSLFITTQLFSVNNSVVLFENLKCSVLHPQNLNCICSSTCIMLSLVNKEHIVSNQNSMSVHPLINTPYIEPENFHGLLHIASKAIMKCKNLAIITQKCIRKHARHTCKCISQKDFYIHKEISGK